MQGAELNILDEGSEDHSADTPIVLAVRLGRRIMFARSWCLGAQRNKHPLGQRSVRLLIEVAALEGYTDILRDLLSWDKSWTQDQLDQALIMTCGQWNFDCVATLLAECAFSTLALEDAMQFAATQEPLLHRGLESMEERLLHLEDDARRQAEVLRLLLAEYAHPGDERASPTASDRFALLNRTLYSVSQSPFMIGALKLLLEMGADPNTLNRPGLNTPLHRALTRDYRMPGRCNEEEISALLDYRARVDLLNDKNETAVHRAMKNGDERMVRKLRQQRQNAQAIRTSLDPGHRE